MAFRKIFIFASLLGLLAALHISAQIAPSRSPRIVDPNRPDPSTQRWYDELKKRENMPVGIGSVRETNETLYALMRDDARKKLAPSEEEKRMFAEFLRQPRTGLIRLAAETDCAKILDISHPDIECLNYYLPGKAKAFSFRRADYSHKAYADVERSRSMFVSPGTFILGLISPVGDSPIEQFEADDADVLALSRFAPATRMDEVVRQDAGLVAGLRIGDLMYRKAVPIRENTTYLLRSIAYKVRFLNLPKTEKPKGSLDTSDRRDIVVVFRVVRTGVDDSLLLLWKEIIQKESPVLTVDMSN